MTQKELENEAKRFRKAIELARDKGKFKSAGIHTERMSKFPYDCCDDTADLFANYLFQKYRKSSLRIDGSYYDDKRGYTCYHSWQEVDGWTIDLTGDQFNNDPALKIKAPPVFVGKRGDFHNQFQIVRKNPSFGIESLGDRSWDRMYRLYNIIMRTLNTNSTLSSEEEQELTYLRNQTEDELKAEASADPDCKPLK